MFRFVCRWPFSSFTSEISRNGMRAIADRKKKKTILGRAMLANHNVIFIFSYFRRLTFCYLIFGDGDAVSIHLGNL